MAVPGQVLSDPTTRTRLIVRRTARDSGGRALELEVFYPPGAGREANRPHFHRTFEEGFEVLAGAATYVLNGKEHTARAGEGFRIPRGAAHLNPWNAGTEPLHLRQLIELDPPDRRTLEAFEDFFETLFGLAREGRTGPGGQPRFFQAAVLLRSLQPSSYAAGVPVPLQQGLLALLGGAGRLLGYSSRYARFAVPGEEYEAPGPARANDYHFLDRWLVPAPLETAWRYVQNAEDYPRWWGSVYDRVTLLAPGDAAGVGKRYAVVVHGALPYKLRMRLESTRVEEPHRLEVRAEGDLEGRGIWRLRAVPGGTEVTYDWKVRATYPLIRALSPVLRPVFEYNHTWCMTRGERDLLRELSAVPGAAVAREG
ncbi:Polyketide cyclase / dehydrase and lipid transport [Calidithermus terrae]|uniref:Polyketide cyclase / dehydrase and lipid transport n=1 Tax=Calidithermus terrae TaxID=1408545 RepID=A0A399EEH4_9DEIN|nr:SRPBCC family protein [Calidithermus terrae]RIH81390.1 Polyketide cyclase / dehydrase and lipid transport [Calidithermus terrae]